MRIISLALFSAMLLPAFSVNAQWRTPDEAVQIAMQSRSKLNNRHLTRSGEVEANLAYSMQDSQSGQTLIYGFNYGDSGFAIVSGNEQTVSLLGYSDVGSLPSDIKDMPDGLSYMLGVYEEQLKTVTVKTRGLSPFYWVGDSVDPFLPTKWNQGSPFNNNCPDNSPAGCVAVAMAQTMRYYQWPEQGVGNRNDYDFSSYKWDWSNMLPDYSTGNYSQDQAKEAATLMRYIGASVDMEYAPGGSGASSLQMMQSLHDYWKYDGGMAYANRDNYSDRQWNSLLYKEIANKRPVLYEGHGKNTSNPNVYVTVIGSEVGVGHVFILDGYKEGLFHVNWGWGGYCDGYFMINNLVPDGNTSPTEFLYNQNAFIGVQPETSEPMKARLESDTTWKLSGFSAADGRSLKIEGFVRCFSLKSYSGKIGAVITDLETQSQTTFLNDEITELQFCHGEKVSVEIPTEGLPVNHSYIAELVYQPAGSSEVEILPVPVNQPTLTFKVGTSDGSSELYPRRMVVEEGTGTWCPWCVRGIVGMEYMTKMYPDNFIGIAVHSGDQMDIEEKYGLSFNSYPSAYFNRIEASSPSSDVMEQFLKNQSGLTTNAMVKINSVTYPDDYSQLKVSANTRFAFDKTGADYRLAYVITEDEVGPYLQNNAYAGESGEMGGFEKLPSQTPVIYNDVARGIYPSLTGVEGSVPSTISACTDYSYEYSFPTPKNCDNYSNLKLTILLYDATTGEIINADRVVCPVGRPNTELSVDMGNEPGTLAEKLGNDIYEVRSLTVSGPINGTDLGVLSAMMGCNTENKNLTHLDLINARIVKGGGYVSFDRYYTLDEDDCLPNDVFSGNHSLKHIAMPSTLKKIEMNALINSWALEEIVLNEGLEEIDNDAFAFNYSCGGSLRKINLPSTLKGFRNGLFYGQYQVEITLDDRNPYLSSDGKAIYSTDFKKLLMVLPACKEVYTLHENCNSIQEIISKQLPGLIAPNINNIGVSAFGNCNEMQYLAIGSRLISIGSFAFSYCHQLEKIYLGCLEVPTGDYRNSIWEEIGNCSLYVPAASIETYKADPFWGKMKAIMPIEDTDYAYLANLGDGYDLVRKSISLSEAGTLAEKLGNDIYEVIDLTISGPINGSDLSVLSSMMGCNTDTKGLSHLDLANARLVKGGGYWFYDEFYVLDEDNYLPYGVFAGNQSLKHITLPSTLKKIGGNAFVNSWALEEIVLNEGLEEIGYNAFAFNYSGGGSLKKINLPSTLKGLGDGMLYGQYQVGITIDDRNPYLSSDGKAIYSTDFKTLLLVIPSCKEVYTLHEKCNSIQQISSKQLPGLIAPNITNIGFCAFWYCNEMTLLAIGSKLQTIEVQAFGHCDQLRSIYLGCTNIPTGGYKDIIWDKIDNCTLYVPSVSIDKYKADTFWGKMKDIKPIEGTEYEYLMEQKEEPTVTFVDNFGNTYDEGSVIKMDNYQKSVFGDYVSLIGLNIKNISEQGTLYRLTATIDQLPGGSFQCCLGDACRRLNKPGSITIEGVSNNGGDIIPIIDTEWIVEKEKYGTLDVVFTLESSTDGTNYTKAGMVTVQFVYTIETGIDAISVEKSNVTNIYSIDGRPVEIPTKGFYIINGTKIVK